jgi:methionyl-tRNA formyltransferase
LRSSRLLLITRYRPGRRRDSGLRRVIDGGDALLLMDSNTMRITLVGSRHFGVTTFEMLRQHGVEIVRVVVADADDRLAAAARATGVEVKVQASPKLVVASEIADGTDLIVTAHSHARVSEEALAVARLGGIGYHPSLLPRHRGIAAVEWTIREGDPIAGGTVYHLADRMDAGAIAAQEWCFVKKGETARELWERALAPLGQKLLGEVIDYAKTHNSLPAQPQDEQFATLAPKLPK